MGAAGINKGVRMNWKRTLKSKISITSSRYNKWQEISINKYWSNRLFYLNISKFTLILDCRKNWIDDMITGVPK